MRTIPTTIDRQMLLWVEEPPLVEEPVRAEAVSIRTSKPEDEGELEVLVDTVGMVL
tara:strand:+ start:38 stop:205 length:168 start_codon:yes stop_codon:yes gene_type:complete